MKNKAKKILFLLLLTCTSCSSLYKFAIDIQNPAAVTLPVSAQNVLILNNSVTQPQDFGNEIAYGKQSDTAKYRLSLDTMAWVAINEIAACLNESNFFKTIAIYHKPLRTDSDWLSKTVFLSPELRAEFYNTENYDALFVINRLLLSVHEDIDGWQPGASSFDPLVYVDIKAFGLLTGSMYVYGKEKPLTTFTVSDSLVVRYMDIGDSIIVFKEIPEYSLQELSRSLGNQAAQRFTPTWKTEERALFRGYNARMQEATGYAANHQWANAESIWTTELGKKTKPVDKAKVAFNLAVANEMQDKLDSAYVWVQKAKEYLTNVNQDSNSQEIDITNKYISNLEKRIQNNRLLDLQWGKE